MENTKNTPTPIYHKLILTCIVGTGCLLVGLAMSLFLRDKMMLFLSLAIWIFSFLKANNYYRIMCDKKYEIVEGTCVAITPKPLRKYRKIKIMDDNGIESSLLLEKHAKVKIGYRYRFYFKETQHLSFGNNYLDNAVSSDHFLGYEELEKNTNNIYM